MSPTEFIAKIPNRECLMVIYSVSTLLIIRITLKISVLDTVLPTEI